MLLGLNTHHTTAVCSRETVVMALYRTHFDRLFKRRNPKTLAKMAANSELQLTRRVIKPNISDSLPLVRCLVFKLQEVKREAGKKFVAPPYGAEVGLHFDLPEVIFQEQEGGSKAGRCQRSRSKSYSWSETVDASQLPQVPFKPRCSLVFRKTFDADEAGARHNTSQPRKHKYYTHAPAVPITYTIARMREPTGWNQKQPMRSENEMIYGEAKVDSWYSGKSFLPGLRSKTAKALSRSNTCYGDATCYCCNEGQRSDGSQQAMTSPKQSRDRLLPERQMTTAGAV